MKLMQHLSSPNFVHAMDLQSRREMMRVTGDMSGDAVGDAVTSEIVTNQGVSSGARVSKSNAAAPQHPSTGAVTPPKKVLNVLVYMDMSDFEL